MTLYTLHCERCGGLKTHESAWDGRDYVNRTDHPDVGGEVYCRSCERGKSKADLDGPTEVWITGKVEQGIGLTIHPEMIAEDETLEEHLEQQLRENIGALVREIADGIREQDVELAAIESEEIEGYPPFDSE